MGKWLDWNEFQALVTRLRGEWSDMQKLKVPPTAERAIELHDLVLLSLYLCLPGRGEGRLLEYIPAEKLDKNVSLKAYVASEKMNLITCVDGHWKMVLSQYKTAKKMGIDVTELDQFDWMTKLMGEYLETYRPLLVGGFKHRFVFCTRMGVPFTQSNFSEFLSSLIKRHTGQKVGVNLLRASAVTQFYDSDKADSPQARESFARVMRHSVPTARAIYDRRNSKQKKRVGLEVLAEFASGTK